MLLLPCELSRTILYSEWHQVAGVRILLHSAAISSTLYEEEPGQFLAVFYAYQIIPSFFQVHFHHCWDVLLSRVGGVNSLSFTNPHKPSSP